MTSWLRAKTMLRIARLSESYCKSICADRWCKALFPQYKGLEYLVLLVLIATKGDRLCCHVSFMAGFEDDMNH